MLLTTAPHYVQALECVVPVKSVWGGIVGSAARFFGVKARIADRGFAITAAGLMLYDVFGRALRSMPTHRMLRRRGLRHLLPDLAPDICGAGIYYEGHITHAERLELELELVLDGEAANPAARAENHAEVLGVAGDVLTWRSARGVTCRARARVILNAGGAWIDAVNAVLGVPSHLMGGSRGSHLVVDSPALLRALDGRMIYFGTPDGRVNLLYPFAGRVLVGAAGSFDCHTGSGGGRGAGALPDRRQVDDVPRLCRNRDRPCAGRSGPGAGGVDCRAGDQGGGRGFPRDAVARQAMAARLAGAGGVSAARADALLARYGTRAEAYLASLAGAGEVMLDSLDDFAREEIGHIARTERVGGIEDILFRRTLIGLTGRDSAAVRAEIAALMA